MTKIFLGDIMNKIEQIKKTFQNNIGRTVMLSVVKGRNRYTIKQCVIQSANPAIFVIRASDIKSGKDMILSYSYSDILTGTVVIKTYSEKEIS